MKCEICQKEFDNNKSLSIHLSKKHLFKKEDMKNYYDKYIDNNTHKCYYCDNESKFINFSKGYHKICSSDICFKKTIATGTYEFIMYKYNLNEEDAKQMQQERALKRGLKIKEGLDKSFNLNNNFFKEKSHQTIEYWLKRGYTEEDAKIKIQEIFNNIHCKTSLKRKNNPEEFLDVNPTQLAYWIKKGYKQEEASKKLKERQSTFTLEKCITKYGKEEGINKYNNRQIKWSEKIEKKYKNGEFSKCTDKNYSKKELELVKIIVDKLKLNEDEYSDSIKNTFYIRIKELNKTFSFDFVFKHKIIEFNGDYWHCNPKYYNENFYHKHIKLYAKDIWINDKNKIESVKKIGFDVLEIWESDYKKDKEKIIQECINFLTN
jgi:hypothetical protein